MIKTTEKNIDFSDINLILCFAGDFAAFFAGLKISKKYNKPLFLYYADPFHGNPSLDNCSERWLIKSEKNG
jgi:hypothetical protein